mmetsp:Transcript_61574/g.165441  ORF Transcript_61574/g.165441 Transcript_61574/m.165441 type:complete len:109 (-) Transcript_61574:863-1189(-)
MSRTTGSSLKQGWLLPRGPLLEPTFCAPGPGPPGGFRCPVLARRNGLASRFWRIQVAAPRRKHIFCGDSGRVVELVVEGGVWRPGGKGAVEMANQMEAEAKKGERRGA